MTRILLIDDEPDILRVLSRSLETDGYAVVCARCGARLYGGCWIEPKEKETCQPKNG